MELIGSTAYVIANPIAAQSLIAAGTLGSGKGGDVTLNARRLIIRDGGVIRTYTMGVGQGGNVTVTASESVDIAGTSTQSSIPSSIATASVGFPYEAFFGQEFPFGPAGSLSIATDRLSVRDGATVTVYSIGAGAAGSINVVADSIALNTQGSIVALNQFGGIGANINLRSQDIQLRGNSRITAEGGNITLNSDILAGLNNSDITAAAGSAEGGRINVNVPNILGFAAATNEQLRRALDSSLEKSKSGGRTVAPGEPLTSELPSSDIAAFSPSGAPALPVGVNPAQGLVEQRLNIVAPADLIAANPCRKGTESAFTVTGKGGVPPSPHDTLSSARSPWTWVEEAGSSATDNVRDVTDRQAREFGEIPAREVVPARGWLVNARGEVMLVANQVAGQLDDRTRPPVSVCVPR